MNKLQEQIKEVERVVGVIQEAVKEIKNTGLNEELIFYALHKVSNKNMSRPRFGVKDTITITQIKAVLRGVSELKDYMFPEE